MTDQKIYIAGYFPDEGSEKDGIRRVATSFKAKDIERAKAKANFIFLEEYEHAQDAAYKILVCEDAPGIPRPAHGTWDTEFLYENDWPEDTGYPVKRQPEKVDFDKLSAVLKIAVLVKYDSTEITKADLPAALELTQDDANTFEGHIVEAISKMPEIANMYPERIQHAIGWVGAKCDHSAKWPEIQKELAVWKKRQDGARKETGSSKSVVKIASEKAEADKLSQQNHASVPLQNEETLKLNIALGLVAKAMDFDILNPPASIVNRARDIIKLKEKPFPAWFAAMSATIGIYEYSTVQIVYSVKISPQDIDRNAGAIQAHINRTFTETDHANPSAEMLAIACGTQKTDEGNNNETEQNQTGATDALDASASTTGAVEPKHNADGSAEGPLETAPQVERSGPFYFLFSDGMRVGRANKLPGLEKALADGGKEISQEEYQARKNGTYKGTDAPVTEQTDKDEQPEVTNLGGGYFSIDGLISSEASEKAKTETPASANITENAAQPSTAPEHRQTSPAIDFQSVGASLEKELQEKSELAQNNLEIWQKVMRTDPRFTKVMTGTGFEGHSINAEYMIMRATELFGPIGSGWGFEILEDRMIPGAPFSEAIYEDKKFICNRMLRDGDGTLLFEQNHSMKIRLWYHSDTAEGSVFAYGATPYMFKTKHGIRCDGEAQKKSLTDAIKKALSLLGFSADVWLGLYDLPEYQAENNVEFAIKHASEKAEDVTRLRTELDEKLTRIANTLEKAVSPNEAKKVFDTLAREVEVHRKAAEAKGDNEHAKYLSGRMRRLCQIKEQRIKALAETQEQSA
ncbi:exodeoxyribonuclease VIII [Kosakonia sacchari]|uniref:exodeoxyribonuclease VIII n=1 Tax=Kosakonia sacchari TaxID=1158459 RepID=UPI002ACDF32D|nr:exodeoxyribonuclease VIII [Kosakonia sacchari]MDZ7320715.1 exodeoxyribonuclease VIII [Kosakonia sacchari]